MDALALERLSEGIDFFESSRSAKLLRHPLRLAHVRMLKALANLRSSPTHTQATTFWGRRMGLVFPDQVSVTIKQYRFFEAGLTTIVLEYLRPGMTFFDIGAHFGYFTLLASDIVGAGGQVHSFEPTPSTIEILRQNAAGCANVKLNQLAVYSGEATLNFTDYGLRYPAFNTLAHGNLDSAARAKVQPKKYDVKATSLDQYIAASGAKPNLIKVDAEGAEEFILEGMKRTLSEVRPMITLEVGDLDPSQPPRCRALLDTVMAHGYEAWSYDEKTRKVTPHRLVERYGYDNVLLIPK